MADYNQPEYSAFDTERMRGRDGAPYEAEAGLLAAANVALALNRPLLLTGEPGCGKTDFAFAAAHGLTKDGDDPEAARPLEYYVRSDTTARDLLYRYDTVRRFSDAQTGGEADRRRAQFAQNYVTLEALGTGLISDARRVVLIDEIDKAQRDLPNDLLRELDQGSFEIPEVVATGAPAEEVDADRRHIKRRMKRQADAPRPLIIITSNVERQLPDAFLRRCLFYYVPFPEEELLVKILDGRFGAAADDRHRDAVSLFVTLRGQALTKKPATAELLDWVGCLGTVFAPDLAWARVAEQSGRARAGQPVNWGALDGLPALIKLREDLAALKLLRSVAAPGS